MLKRRRSMLNQKRTNIMASNDTEYAQTIADMLIEQLERGVAPWQKPWSGGEKFMPYNPISGTSYRGSNALYLMAMQERQGYSENRWMTYKQAEAVGGQVRKGEKSTKIRYWQWTTERDKQDANGNPVIGADGQPEREKVRLQRPWVRQFAVFNADQIDGLPPHEQRPQISKVETVERAEKILANSGAKIIHKGGDRAFYSSSTDQITMPNKEQFSDTYNYYSTALHELGHWTGHHTRLDRELGNAFGSEKYAKEELRAEIASLMLADEIGVQNDPQHVEQHAAYVGSWIKALKNDPTEILRAASDATKITRYVMGLEQQQEQEIQQEQNEQQGHYSDRTMQALIDRHGWTPTDPDRPLDNVGKVYDGVGPAGMIAPNGERRLIAGYNADRERRRYVAVSLGDNMIADFDGREAAPEEVAARLDLAASTYADEQRVKRGHHPRYVEEASRGQTVSGQANSADYRPNIRDEPTPIDAKFRDKDAVKKLGAKWDKAAKTWFVPTGVDLTPFAAWLPTEANAADQNIQPGTNKSESVLFGDWDGYVQGVKERLAAAQKALDDWPKTEAELTEKEDRDRQELSAAHDAGIVTDEMFAEQSALLDGADHRQQLLDALIEARDLAQEKVDEAIGGQSTETVSPMLAAEKTYLSVPYRAKDEAKALGAKWDKGAKSWYAPVGTDLRPFEKFMPRPASEAVSLTGEAQTQFADAMKRAGLVIDGVPEMDGQIHRVQAAGDKGRERSGAYCGYLDGRPGGWYQNYKTGEKTNWKIDVDTKLSAEDRASMLAQAAQQRQNREQERKAGYDIVAKSATGIVATLAPVAPENAYVTKKGISPVGLLQATDVTVAAANEQLGEGNHSIAVGDMVVPMIDASGAVRSVQVIKPNGWKGFLPGGQVSGSFSMLGEARNSPDARIWVAEGMATAASIHQATGEPVAVAFNAANLKAVANEIRQQNPDAKMLIAGDDDRHLPRRDPPQPNVGVEKAQEAAAAVNGLAILPTFGPELDGMDWNDIAQKEGLDGLTRELNETVTEAQNREDERRRVEGRKLESGAERDGEREDALTDAISSFRNLDRGIGGQTAPAEPAQTIQEPAQSQTHEKEATTTQVKEKMQARPGLRLGGRR